VCEGEALYSGEGVRTLEGSTQGLVRMDKIRESTSKVTYW